MTRDSQQWPTINTFFAERRGAWDEDRPHLMLPLEGWAHCTIYDLGITAECSQTVVG